MIGAGEVGKPKVSVHMPAFNHEQFIAAALNSILMQRVDFGYEIVIGEDCSTDGTLAVAREYQRRYPEKIKLLEHRSNLGIWQNDQSILASCHGEYVAWLESDDFWTSPYKLQKQVDYLDRHPEAGACFHRAGCMTDNTPPITWRGGPEASKPFYTVDDLLEQGHFIPSCTAMFRASLVRPALNWTRGTPFLETTYAIRFALFGPIGFLDEEMAMFRFHDNGVYSQADQIQNLKVAINAHKLVGKGFNLTSRDAYWRGLAGKYATLARHEFDRGRRFAVMAARAKAFWCCR